MNVNSFLPTIGNDQDKSLWGINEHPLSLIAQITAMLVHKYQEQATDWPSWEPNVLLDLISKWLGIEKLHPTTKNKILALQTALSTDIPWEDWDVFENFCLAMVNETPIWGEMQPLDPEEMAFGIGVLNAIGPDEEFGTDVLGYIAAVLVYNGFLALPNSHPLPDVEDLVLRMISDDLKPISKQIVQLYDSGAEGDINAENSLVLRQVGKLHELEKWYNLGREMPLKGVKKK